MNQNSNIRRIDELGRIVIPKDIRKKMHIKDSEPLEIFLENDEIHIKKYSSLPDIEEFIENLIDIGTRTTGNKYILTTREKVLASSDNNLKTNDLSDEIKNLIVKCTEKKNEKIDYRIGSTTIKGYANIIPVIVDNDRSGIMIEYNCENEIPTNEIIKIFVTLIEKQLNNY